MATPLAHSARDGVPPQTYFDHISNVRRYACANAEQATAVFMGDRERFCAWVDSAALVHDLGKLDEANQQVLGSSPREALPVFHEDAGVAALWERGQKESTVLVAAHHGGLFSKSAEKPTNKNRPFRDERSSAALNGGTIDRHVDEHLKEYWASHEDCGLPGLSAGGGDGQLHRCGFSRRLALSCLVDADHGDTARHYGGEVETPDVQTRWAERAAALQRYVDGFPVGKAEREKRRNALRRHVFDACRDAPIEPSMRACDAPVGSGKTTAVMAHLLRVATKKKLRHIFVVLPYTNIITQSVEVYRKALLLEGERPEDIVAEHHHRADFEDIELRQLATLWKAPIIVTTAVQFFETLGSHHPSRLRKLHELPGSAVFVDEMHAAMPSHLWPQMWRWLETWTRDWGGHIVFASGSLPRFWEIHDYATIIRGDSTEPMPSVPDLVEDQGLKDELRQTEGRRVRYCRRDKEPALNCEGLIDFVLDQDPIGPRLLIVNTVQTAAVIAHAMRHACHDVLHLSTAIAPAHRDLIVGRVKLRLREQAKDWTLVATSCVEAGMDFSFRSGFRERASTASLIQVGGRVNRGGEQIDGAGVWDILLSDDRFRRNPGLKISRVALGQFSDEELNDREIPTAALATRAMQREWTAGAADLAQWLVRDEQQMEYRPIGSSSDPRGVAQRCRVIPQLTATVIVDSALAQAVKEWKKVSTRELLLHSVQMWPRKVDELGLEQVRAGNREGELGLYALGDLAYEPDFIGYMAGVLKQERLLKHKDEDAWIV